MVVEDGRYVRVDTLNRRAEAIRSEAKILYRILPLA